MASSHGHDSHRILQAYIAEHVDHSGVRDYLRSAISHSSLSARDTILSHLLNALPKLAQTHPGLVPHVLTVLMKLYSPTTPYVPEVTQSTESSKNRLTLCPFIDPLHHFPHGTASAASLGADVRSNGIHARLKGLSPPMPPRRPAKEPFTAAWVGEAVTSGRQVTMCPGGLGCCLVGLRDQAAGFQDLPVNSLLTTALERGVKAAVTYDSTGPLWSAVFTAEGLSLIRTRLDPSSKLVLPTAPMATDHCAMASFLRQGMTDASRENGGFTIAMNKLPEVGPVIFAVTDGPTPCVACLWAECPVSTPYGWLFPPFWGLEIHQPNSFRPDPTCHLTRRLGFDGGRICLCRPANPTSAYDPSEDQDD